MPISTSKLCNTKGLSHFVDASEIDIPDAFCGHCLETVLDRERELPEEQVNVQRGGGAIYGKGS